ncbi:hypothetical protein DFJ74DRAFT_673918 [Hyaloraphidium curvatum]|nr:hypothetical protein DFJ74DRAFT_673918 [Hyaloraphidium curvatum]
MAEAQAVTNAGEFRDQAKVFAVARSKAEKDRIHKVAIEESLKGAFYGLMVGTALNMALTRYSPAYAKFNKTPKWIMQLAFPIAGFVINGEQAALSLEREYALSRSYVKDLDGLPGEIKQAMQSEVKHEKFTMDDVKSYILENRYKVVGLTWAGVVGSVLITTWANKNMPVAQKIITARVAAQASALGGFVAFAAAASVPVSKDTVVDKLNKQYYEKMLTSGSSTEAAKWAEKWHQELLARAPEEVEARKQKIQERLEAEANKKKHHLAMATQH